MTPGSTLRAGASDCWCRWRQSSRQGWRRQSRCWKRSEWPRRTRSCNACIQGDLMPHHSDATTPWPGGPAIVPGTRESPARRGLARSCTACRASYRPVPIVTTGNGRKARRPACQGGALRSFTCRSNHSSRSLPRNRRCTRHSRSNSVRYSGPLGPPSWGSFEPMSPPAACPMPQPHGERMRARLRITCR